MYYWAMDETENGSVYKTQIDKILKSRGFSSYAELAQRAGLNRSTLSRLFKGKDRRGGNASTLTALADTLDTTVEFVSGKTNDPRRNDAPPLPDYATEVVESMRRLDRGRNYELLVIAKSFVSASEDIRQLTRQEFVDLLLETGDQLGSEEDTNRIMEILQRLERKWNGSDGDDDAPKLPSSEPS